MAAVTPTKKQSYNSDWYANFRSTSAQSADVIVPLLLDCVAAQSVVDVGCGLGVWLDIYRKHGVKEIYGVDGDFVAADERLIAPEQFQAADLTLPLELARRFDLANCLEVAEHLPAGCADRLVDSLVQLAPVIFFSAAIPNQGGTNHVNERWPQYWIERFRQRGYEAIDLIRPQVWDDDRVDFWYAQNAIVFANQEGLKLHSKLAERFEQAAPTMPLATVHPRLFQRTTEALENTVDYRVRRFMRSLIAKTGISRA